MITLIVNNKKEDLKETRISDVFLITKEFKTSTEFSQFIEKKSYQTGLTCMDVILDYCERNEIEVESVNKLLSSSLKEKVKAEAQSLNMLKEKENQLPI